MSAATAIAPVTAQASTGPLIIPRRGDRFPRDATAEANDTQREAVR